MLRDRHDVMSYGNPNPVDPDIVVEIINSSTEFKWRLKMGGQESPWFTSYESILSHTFPNGQTWFLATAYWGGTFPELVPFQIKPAGGEK